MFNFHGMEIFLTLLPRHDFYLTEDRFNWTLEEFYRLISISKVNVQFLHSKQSVYLFYHFIFSIKISFFLRWIVHSTYFQDNEKRHFYQGGISCLNKRHSRSHFMTSIYNRDTLSIKCQWCSLRIGRVGSPNAIFSPSPWQLQEYRKACKENTRSKIKLPKKIKKFLNLAELMEIHHNTERCYSIWNRRVEAKHQHNTVQQVHCMALT